jgi:hypothetical protein
MSSTIQVGNRTFTTDAICEQLSNSDLLPQVIREMIIDEILADWELEIDSKIPYNRQEFRDGCDRLGKLAGYQGLNQLQLYKIVDRHLRLQKFKHARWNSRVYSYYLQRKSSFDRVEFSLIGVTDPGLAEEIFFRVQSGEQSLRDLAFKYSECEAARDDGRVSSIDIDKSHPAIAPYLKNLRAGEISPIFELDNLHVFVRLEDAISAELNEGLTQILIDELFETWVQQEISTKLGLFELEDIVDLPELIVESQPQSINSERLELINQMDELPKISKFIEPSSSFFFPKEMPNQKYNFDEPVDGSPTSSFFFPKDTPTEIIRNTRELRRGQKIGYFLLFFSIFLSVEIVGINMFHRFYTPENSVGSHRVL